MIWESLGMFFWVFLLSLWLRPSGFKEGGVYRIDELPNEGAPRKLIDEGAPRKLRKP